MCGLIAAFNVPGSTFLADDFSAPLALMRPRGPDAEGLWQDPGVLLGHRRLAILDLDVRSNQPMHSACGRYLRGWGSQPNLMKRDFD
jgi:asparagine synthase (glutamine-hydrolysing)